MNVPFSPHPHQKFLFFVFFIIAVLAVMGLYLIVGWIGICLIISDDEHFLKGLLAICMFSLENIYWSSLPCFEIDHWDFFNIV